jgi:hypothetical protein
VASHEIPTGVHALIRHELMRELAAVALPPCLVYVDAVLVIDQTRHFAVLRKKNPKSL